MCSLLKVSFTEDNNRGVNIAKAYDNHIDDSDNAINRLRLIERGHSYCEKPNTLVIDRQPPFIQDDGHVSFHANSTPYEYFVKFTNISSRIIVNITEFGETVVQNERFSAIKQGLIHHFLHLKMPVPSQEYDSCCPFVYDVFFCLILPCE